ncbi:MAG: hypothetical protein F9K25_18595 [Candidatus Contendobacter sp.]|nr:MAG: hypothetical protein F9K25_18595 [Candidatus Contendobacter sp.]
MNSTDKPGFATAILAIAEIYGKALSPAAIGIYWNALQGYPLAKIQSAIERHVTDPTSGQFFPKPADIIRYLPAAQTDDGHPDPDEAWGLLVRLIRDERETGVLTDEMRAGWAACQPILDLGDEVGARRCFLAVVYARHVQEARQRGLTARWTATLGTDARLREMRLKEAVQARRIGLDRVRALLPGLTPASIGQVAGLLEGPGASFDELETAERLRALAAMLRASSAAPGKPSASARYSTSSTPAPAHPDRRTPHDLESPNQRHAGVAATVGSARRESASSPPRPAATERPGRIRHLARSPPAFHHAGIAGRMGAHPPRLGPGPIQ